MVTIYDIAKYCGVSAATVSKVINHYPTVSKSTQDRVHRAMKELHYIPNTTAQQLSKGGSKNVGVLIFFGEDVPCFKHVLCSSILDSFKIEMEKNHYDLVFISKNVGGQKGGFYEHCISRNVEGVIIFGDSDAPEVRPILHSDLPVVAFDYIGEDISGVYSDNYQKMCEMTQYLVDLGHREIVYIHGENSETTKLRVNGFCDTLKKNGIEIHEHSLMAGRYWTKKETEELTKKILQSEHRPSAIMYPDDYCALMGMGIIQEMGLSIPQDISITGFDGIEMGKMVHPYLTTISQDTKQLGKVLADELFERIQNPHAKPKQICVDASLVVGESAGIYQKK